MLPGKVSGGDTEHGTALLSQGTEAVQGPGFEHLRWGGEACQAPCNSSNRWYGTGGVSPVGRRSGEGKG